jgi:hypothetical protein
MLVGIVSPIRPLLMTLIVALDLSLESSRRITSGYVAADSETLKFAERHFSADDNSSCVREGALPDSPTSNAAPIDAIVRAVRVRRSILS